MLKNKSGMKIRNECQVRENMHPRGETRIGQMDCGGFHNKQGSCKTRVIH